MINEETGKRTVVNMKRSPKVTRRKTAHFIKHGVSEHTNMNLEADYCKYPARLIGKSGPIHPYMTPCMMIADEQARFMIPQEL